MADKRIRGGTPSHAPHKGDALKKFLVTYQDHTKKVVEAENESKAAVKGVTKWPKPKVGDKFIISVKEIIE